MILSGLGWGALLAVLWLSFPREFWPKLKAEPEYQHLVFGSAAVLLLLWLLQARIYDGLAVHFLGITLVTLCHGWRIAVWICLLPLLVMLALGQVSPVDGGLYALCTFVLPALFSAGMFWFSYYFLPRHLFIYIFVAAFFASALTMLLHMGLTSAWFYLDGRYPWHIIQDNYLVLALLISFPEALLNGMAVTLMALYRPHWLRTFYENEYLSSAG
ncbi:energy-coupling factor ABC transporter permease [Alkalimonas sp. MEB108]|uniref:Energy-coupling factor ABC transporter permease n=1 Tax=Alkalimonas cellulosilytica TaxID=3058395 RepID=A0ABU7J666_9GAMM|nr:energy-coupling factor ABC transporter permease [Alkalimonas sp. MEB108]MEE2001862.1 energy-coupling factor ABC transporter permease [Alkalimonas sp. MEB108]